MKLIPPKVDGQSVNASDYNPPVQEPQKIVLSSEQSLVEADNFQMAKAAAYYSAVGDYYQDTGTTNDYVVGVISPREGIPVYSIGQKIRFVAANTNTGASVINVQALGSGSLLNSAGGALVGGEIQAGEKVTIEYDGSNWRLGNGAGGLLGLSHTVDGLEISNNGAAPTTTIDFASGRCSDSDRSFLIVNTTGGFNKDMTTNWADGTGNGGKASAISITPDTWYFGFVLSKADGTFDAGIDTNITATNLLADASGSGYDKWRRTFAIYTLTDSTIRQIVQEGNWFWYENRLAATADSVLTTISTSPISAPLKVPTLIKPVALIEYFCSRNPGPLDFDFSFYNSDVTSYAPNASNPAGTGSTITGRDQRGRAHLKTNSSGQIQYIGNVVNNNCRMNINTLAYQDFRID